jgi:Peptidase family M23
MNICGSLALVKSTRIALAVLCVGTGCVSYPARAPATTTQIGFLDEAWVAPLAIGKVLVFDLSLPACFGDHDRAATVSVRSDSTLAEFHGDTLEQATGSIVVLPRSGPLFSALRREGRVFFGWSNAAGGSLVEVVGECVNGARFTATTKIANTPLPQLRLPFATGRWKAFNGPSPTSKHRRAAITFASAEKPVIFERFGIDWMLAEDEPQMRGETKDNHTYRSYGTPLLAVADGTIVALQDGIPENEDGPSSRAIAITEQTIGGNYLGLKLDGSDAVAFYAHFQAHTLRVAVGDHVHAGDVLGLLGKSGNSSSPHLHFHLARTQSMAGNEKAPFSPLRTPSIPYQITKLGLINGNTCTPYTNILPSEDAVVDASGCAP